MLAAALEGVEALYQRCRAQGRSLDLVVLPEALVAGGAGQPELAEEIPGPVTGRMLELATRLDLHLAFGVPERTPRGLYSSVVLVGPGEVQGLYRKLHLTAADREWGCLPGDLGFPTFDLPLGRVALLCADDLLYPEAPRSVAKKGADLICAPGAWTDPSTTWLWADRWSGNDTFLAVANLAGGGFAGGSAVYGDLERGDRARVSEPEGSAYVRVNTAWGRRVRQKETLRRLQPHWYAPLVGGQVGRAHRR
jgi:predicted amidohydrolase